MENFNIRIDEILGCEQWGSDDNGTTCYGLTVTVLDGPQLSAEFAFPHPSDPDPNFQVGSVYSVMATLNEEDEWLHITSIDPSI